MTGQAAASPRARGFRRLRWRQVRNNLGNLLHNKPVVLVTMIACTLFVWVGVFAFSYWGFLYLRHEDLLFSAGIVDLLFDYLFVALAVMLVFSTAIILYSSLFGTPESAFLLCTPAAADRVFAYKFQGAIGFSSWAFVLLGSPLLIAYGLAYQVEWYFYPLLPLFFLGFALLPGAVGALLCLLVVNYLPRRRKQVLWLAGLAVTGLAGWRAYAMLASAIDVTATDPLERLLGQLTVLRGPLLPSHWMTRGVQAAAQGDLAETTYRLALLWSNGLLLYTLSAWAAARLYRRGYNRLATGGDLRRRYGGAWLDRAVTALLPFLARQTRLLIVKDFRTFRRDPAQWFQVLIFGGLILLYFGNTRQFYQEGLGRSFQGGVSLVNLAAIGLLLCAYTGRFIYPMVSLEGRKFWILGLLPLRRDRLLWGKFAFSAAGSVVTAELLVIFSDLLLGVSAMTILIHALTVAMLALGLSGLSVGLGAWMPNFRETDPSKIAVGFGGTLNLVAGLLFLVVEVLLMAVPWHLYVIYGEQLGVGETVAYAGVGIGLLAGVVCGLIAVVVPLQIGAQTLRRMEF